MAAELGRNWWILLIRGIAAVVFGILAILWPGVTLLALVLLFGAYAMIDGISAIVLGSTAQRHFWPMLLVGILSIVAGLIAFFYPGITLLALLVTVAAWSIVRGVLEIVTAIRLRRFIQHEWLLILSGVVSIVLGAVLLAWPGIGLLSLIWVIGIYAVIFGAMLIALSLRLRQHGRQLEPPEGQAGMARPI